MTSAPSRVCASISPPGEEELRNPGSLLGFASLALLDCSPYIVSWFFYAVSAIVFNFKPHPEGKTDLIFVKYRSLVKFDTSLRLRHTHLLLTRHTADISNREHGSAAHISFHCCV